MNKIIESMDIDSANDFVEIDDYGEFIMSYRKKIQSLLELNVEMILYLFLKVLLIIHFKHRWFNIVQINKHAIKIYNHHTYTQIIIKKFFSFFL